MLGIDAQQRAREAIRQADKALINDVAQVSALQKHAENFRDMLFAAFQFIENETMTLQELQVTLRRPEKQQLHVQSRDRLPFALQLDTEPSYDTRPQTASNNENAEPAAPPAPELALRLFAVLTTPYQGLLRHYTIYSDGMWKRTTFAITPHGVQERSALVPRFNPDVLTLEAVNLLSYVCILHPTWAALGDEVETMTLDKIKERTRVKHHLSGLGAPRRPS